MKLTKREENVQLFNRWAKTYDAPLLRFWMKGFHKVALRIIKNKESKVLDISCGSGELLRELAKRKFKKLYGVDIAPKMLDVAGRKLPSFVKLQEADVHALPFPHGMFDYVISTEAFHHYDKQKEALQEMKRVTHKNGYIIVADINFFFHFIHFLFEKLEPGCVKVNSKKQIRRIFDEVGLKIIEQKRTFLFAITTVGVVR